MSCGADSDQNTIAGAGTEWALAQYSEGTPRNGKCTESIATQRIEFERAFLGVVQPAPDAGPENPRSLSTQGVVVKPRDQKR